MFFVHLMYALVFGLSIAWVWSAILNSRGPWGSFFWFFFVIFLFSWGGGVWVPPFGPVGWGVSWLPFLSMGIFMALLLSATTPLSARRHKETKGQVAAEKAVEAEFDMFFGIFIFVLVAIIFCNYFWHSHGI